MKSRINRLLVTFVAVMTVTTNAYAGCKNEQFAGTWDVVFSDGNYCKLVFNREGEILLAPDFSLSVCVDPFQGQTVPNGGTYELSSNCSIEVQFVVQEDTFVFMAGRIIQPRIFGTGIFVSGPFPGEQPETKGSFNIVRLK